MPKKKTEKTDKPVNPIARIRPATEVMYDLQKLRIATGNRMGPQAKHAEAVLGDEDRLFLTGIATKLADLEREAAAHLAKRLKSVPLYNNWLKHQRGVGPTMSACILSSFDIHHADTVSKFWAYAGLDVMKDGRGRRRVKGEKLHYNPWLKTKLVGVLADSFIKVGTWDSELGCYVQRRKVPKSDPPEYTVKPLETDTLWRRFYDDYKHRKLSQILPTCSPCKGTGKIKKETCSNCGGTGGPAPWGNSDAHRDRAAKRYMIKQFLIELHKRWRESEDLPVRPPYREEYLGKPPHRGGGSKEQARAAETTLP